MNTETLKFLVGVIDVCATRGAFRGDELFNVGAARNALLEHVRFIEESQIVATETAPVTEVAPPPPPERIPPPLDTESVTVTAAETIPPTKAN